MKAYRILTGRRQDALERIDHEVWDPQRREVRLRVRAVSLNYRDLMIAWRRCDGRGRRRYAGPFDCLHAPRRHGSCRGRSGRFSTKLDLVPLLVRATRLIGVTVGSRAMFEDLTRFVTSTRIRPAIDPFDEAREAYEYLESGKHFGKIVIKLCD